MMKRNTAHPTTKKPELLAPAGSLETALAAFDAGADAVYAGLDRFNARERGVNFTPEDMSMLVEYANRHKKRVYVTMNTLLKQNELTDAGRMVSELAQMSVHAVIVQDIGLIRMIRNFFPTLEIHGSTQMGIHNSAGLETAVQLGLKRVILERQITLDELRLIRRSSTMDIEIFVHGALCCCRSGACLFSSWMGGWSGNRGKCKQPCRRRYRTKNGNGFFLSMQDLCLIEQIPQLMKLGITSFKIEGRLRRRDYVTDVVSAYRMIMDAPENDQSKTIGQAKQILSGTNGRRWSSGFLYPANFEEIVRHDAMGVSGLLAGNVLHIEPDGFTVKVSRPISRGDFIRVQPQSGDEGPSYEITELRIGKKPIKTAYPGEECFIESDNPPPEQGMIFKTSRGVPEMTARTDNLHPLRKSSDLHINVRQSGLTITAANTEDHALQHVERDIEKAKRAPLTQETVVKAFSASDSETWSPGSVSADVEPGLFMPVSELKKIRRSFWEWFLSAERKTRIEVECEQALKQLEQTLNKPCSPKNSTAETVILSAPGQRTCSDDPASVTAVSIDDATETTDEVVLPDFCSEKDLPDLQKKVTALLQAGFKRFRLTSLFAFRFFEKTQSCFLTSSFSIPCTNSLAATELHQLNASRAMAWPELEKEIILSMADHSPIPIELYTLGRIPLLSTRALLRAEGSVRDQRGGEFIFKREGDLTRVYSRNMLCLDPIEGLSEFKDLSMVQPGESGGSKFNFNRELI